MPSGRTHDAVTLLLAPPTFIAAWGATGSFVLAGVTTVAMLFGGFMFGPDLDIQSRQYTRWGVFRFLWLPYRVIFRHRSRWSHGIIFGTLIRVVYFALMMALVISAGVYLRALFMAGGAAPGWEEIVGAWRAIESGIAAHARIGFDKNLLLAIFAGLWWGAASHTLTDVAWSVVRKGSEIF